MFTDRHLLVAAGTLLLALSSRASTAPALNDPANGNIAAKDSWPQGAAETANSATLVYSGDTDGGEFFCYAGPVADFNAMLKKFSAIKSTAHPLRIEAGFGAVSASKTDTVVFYDWRLDLISDGKIRKREQTGNSKPR
jgi:hypothetical protein